MSDRLDLTVIVPTTPWRDTLREEALASIDAQTLPVEQVCLAIDRYADGPATAINRAALGAVVDTEWIFRLDDDDLLDADHFEVLSHWLDTGADIVYTWCRIEEGGELHPEQQFQARWQDDYGWELLRDWNWIPCSAAIRTSLFREIGGYNLESGEEDWDLWKRALAAGARFRCVPAVTWTYRMNAAWEHRSDFTSSGDGTDIRAWLEANPPCDHEHRCCPRHDTHSTPHIECILR